MKKGRGMHAEWDRARESEVAERWQKMAETRLAETLGETRRGTHPGGGPWFISAPARPASAQCSTSITRFFLASVSFDPIGWLRPCARVGQVGFRPAQVVQRHDWGLWPKPVRNSPNCG